jgi:hypothetical protein
MRLAVHELYASGLKQKVEVTSDASIVAIRPHLMKYGSPAGSLKIQFLDGNEKLIGETDTVLISSISAIAYFHGYITFNCNFNVKESELHYIKLVGIGYTFSESNYIGWCNDYDLRKYDATDTRTEGFYAPLDYEFWQIKKV